MIKRERFARGSFPVVAATILTVPAGVEKWAIDSIVVHNADVATKYFALFTTSAAVMVSFGKWTLVASETKHLDYGLVLYPGDSVQGVGEVANNLRYHIMGRAYA
jgi:hypothetical protein